MAPKRRSLRERDDRAIATSPPAVLPGQTTIDMPGEPESKPVQTAASGVEGGAASPAASMSGSVPQQALRGQGESVRRLGIYFHRGDFTAAKAAYLADWRAGGTADTFATWIAGVLLQQAQLDSAQRAAVALPVRTGSGGSTRSFALPQAVHDAVRAAVIADQGIGRWVSASMWAAAAIHAAAEATRRRAGGRLPPPPARLPNQLRR